MLKYSQDSHREMLTKELRQLEEDGLVTRKIYTQVPPKVEYSLTETGKSLIPILDQLCDWGYEHMDDHIKYKCEYPENKEPADRQQ